MTGRDAQTHAPVRVHWIRVPTPKTSAASVVLLIVGIGVSFVLALVAAFSFGAILRISFPSEWWLVGIAFIVFPVVGAVLWTWAFARFRLRRLRQESIIRLQRLESLESHADSPTRLPHRSIERVLRRQYQSGKRLAVAMQDTGPGRLIAVEDPASERYPHPAPLDIDFEPVDITEDSEQVWHMVWMNLDAQDGNDGPGADTHADETLIDHPVRTWKELMRTIWEWASVPFMIGVLVYWASSDPSPHSLGMLLVMLALMIFPRLLSNERWWVVPGGLVFCQDRAWKKGMRVKLFTPDNTPLVMDLRSGMGYLLDDGRLRMFNCAELTRWLVIAGWISRARRPSLDEVQAFIGPTERAEPRASARADSHGV